MQKTKKAFSFVEIIIVISIITLLAIVGLSYQGASNQKSQNTRVIGDIGTINNSILSYLEEKKTLPEPKGNKNYFSKIGEYSHNETTVFGVHGFVTENLMSKRYLNFLPLDPRTNQYYAYGKSLDNKFYETAGVLNIEGDYQTKLIGNYPGETGPYSLIREYNGPDFISDKSKFSFPYNPTDKLLIAKINNTTGTVTINGNSDNILSHTLVQGDTIIVSAGATATIFFSDGSQSLLGDTNKESKLVLSNMEFIEDDNLLTRIKLALESGTLWTKATNLNSDNGDSEFQVQTQDTSASVRGTIFGVSYNGSSTSVTVEKGVVEIKEKQTDTLIKTLNTTNKSYNSTISLPTDFNIKVKKPLQTPQIEVIEKDIIEEYLEEKKIESKYGKLYLYDDFSESNDTTYKNNFIKNIIKTKFKSFYEYGDESEEQDSNANIKRKNNGFTISNGKLIANGSNGYLKYENLNLGNDFVIEMSVKLGKTKKSGGPYFLLDGEDEFELYIENKKIHGMSEEIEDKYFDDKFHIFVLDSSGNLKIDGKDIGQISMNTNFSTLYVGVNYDNLFGTSSYGDYYNSKINYIEIYTK